MWRNDQNSGDARHCLLAAMLRRVLAKRANSAFFATDNVFEFLV